MAIPTQCIDCGGRWFKVYRGTSGLMYHECRTCLELHTEEDDSTIPEQMKLALSEVDMTSEGLYTPVGRMFR